MRILIALTYYRPHYSGLTIYTERLARALVDLGHQVTVLTSQFEKELPREEIVDGVKVIRLPVALHISKGVIMPSMPFVAWREIRKADIVNIHLPQLDAAPIALNARILGKPVLLTYHCDLLLPSGFINRLANIASDVANHIASSSAAKIVTNTMDYAYNSGFLGRYIDKVQEIPPPATLVPASKAAIDAFRVKHSINPDDKVIGMVGRLASEKGAEYLARALPIIQEKYPNARVVHVGQYEGVMGEEAYAQKLASLLKDLGDRWKFLGLISDEELTAFFNICEVVATPSTNSTESFGIVQVESMICGTPTVVSDMPGMRRPVQITGMGRTFSLRDVQDLANAIIDILDAPENYQGDLPWIIERFSPETIAKEYETLMLDILGKA
ncbi:MAG: glycosyltransferase family 4 protein [Chloroflexi bacterium]|nr:glycosyltransferase family 4 protein [Chloroflexota bacterium]